MKEKEREYFKFKSSTLLFMLYFFMISLFVFSACFYCNRRDSFITHRAFCDALAQESARAITATNPLLSSQNQVLHSHGIQALQLKREQELNLATEIPPWLACPPSASSTPGPSPLNLSSSHLFSTNLDQPLVLHHHHENPSSNPNPNSTTTLPPFQHPSASPHMSATALLQKAAQMGATMSKPPLSQSMLRPGHQAHMPDNTSGVSGLGLSSREEMGSGFANQSLVSFGNKAAATVSVPTGFMHQLGTANSGPPSHLLHDMMSSTSLPSSSGFDGSSFEEAFNGVMNNNPKRDGNYYQDAFSKATESSPLFSRSDENGGAGNNNRGGNEELTRDFLGLRAFTHKDFLNMAGFEQMNSSPSSRSYGQHNRNQPHWQG